MDAEECRGSGNVHDVDSVVDYVFGARLSHLGLVVMTPIVVAAILEHATTQEVFDLMGVEPF